VQIKADDEWMSQMRAADRLMVTMMTAPLLVRYRYPLAVGANL
jgi:hypothetical protein